MPLIMTVEVIGSDESLKYWILYNGLKQDNFFKENLWCKEAHNMKDLLKWALTFINLEEKISPMGENHIATDAGTNRASRKESNQLRKEFDRVTRDRYDKYTSLNTS